MPRIAAVLLAVLLASASWAAQAVDRQLVIQPVKPAPAGEKRTALVIGNAAYKNGPLRNPVRDARAIGKALAETGFKVTVVEDATQATMWKAIRVFGDELLAGGVGLFYFAGHGMQVRGRNYLIPVNADIQREDEVEYQAVDANLVLTKMDTAKNALNLLILDACRNNPFARAWRSQSVGLAQMDAPSGTLVAFATAPGSVASDGDGDNGLYTKHLLANIRRPGLAIEQLFKDVRIGVSKDTGDSQVPWESSSLKGNFSFVAPDPTAVSSAGQRQAEQMIQELLAKQRAALEEELARQRAASGGTPQVERQMELAFWESIKSSKDPADYQAYLAQYPQGTFAALARSRAGSAAAPVKVEKAKPIAVVAAPPAAVAPAAVPPAAVPTAAPAAGGGLQAGDRWEYRYRDATTSRTRNLRYEIAGVSKDGVLQSGGFTDDVSAVRAFGAGAQIVFDGVWEFSPYLLAFDPPKPGQAWRGLAAERAAVCRRPMVSCRIDARVEGTEKITVPAGTFDALKVLVEFRVFDGAGGGRGADANLTGTRHFSFWYAAETGRVARAAVRTVSGNSLDADYDLELTAYSRGGATPPPLQVAAVAPTVQTDAPSRPALKAGDRWEYTWIDSTSRRRRSVRIEARHVSPDAVEEFATAGDEVLGSFRHGAEHRLVYNSLWLELAPYLLSFDDAKPGATWMPKSAERVPSCRGLVTCRFQVRVEAAEPVATAAGTFDAVKVVVAFSAFDPLTGGRDPGSNLSASRVLTYWYSPQAKRMVKTTLRTITGNASDPDYDVELTAYTVQ